MKMPFGTFKKTPVSQLPVEYCQWVLATIENLKPRLRTELEIQANRDLMKEFLDKGKEVHVLLSPEQAPRENQIQFSSRHLHPNKRTRGRTPRNTVPIKFREDD